MTEGTTGPRTSRTVTIEDAARYEDGAAAVERVTGLPFPCVRFANGQTADLGPRQVAVLYGPGDVGVMDAGEYARWFGLSWHYGPTSADPDPGSMWCYDCGGQVASIDGGYVCGGCGRQSES